MVKAGQFIALPFKSVIIGLLSVDRVLRTSTDEFTEIFCVNTLFSYSKLRELVFFQRIIFRRNRRSIVFNKKGPVPINRPFKVKNKDLAHQQLLRYAVHNLCTHLSHIYNCRLC